MKQFLIIALLTVIGSFSAMGQTPDTKLEGKTQDEAAINKLMKDVEVAWNSHDGVSWSMLFVPDADFTNWRGTLRIHGREEIKKMNGNLAVGMFRQSKLTLTGTHIRFVSPGVAAVLCDWEIVGTIDYDGKSTMPPRTYYPLMVVTKEDGNGRLRFFTIFYSSPCRPARS
jgi:uncharacterized protein (TIGR02246 family)